MLSRKHIYIAFPKSIQGTVICFQLVNATSNVSSSSIACKPKEWRSMNVNEDSNQPH